MVRVRPRDGDVSARRLTEALAGRDPALPPTAVVPLVPTGVQSPQDRLDLYRAAAHDRGLDDAVRLQALRALVRGSPGDSASADVREVVATAGDGPLLAGAAGLLARLGGPADVPLLERVAATLRPADARRRVDFAASVLAHRHGLPDPTGPLAAAVTGDGDPGAEALPVTSTTLVGEDRDRPVAAASAEWPHLSDGAPQAVAVSLGGRSVTLVVRDGLEGGARVSRAPDLPAVVLTADPEHGDLVPAFLVLTEPEGGPRDGSEGGSADGSVLVRVSRPDGTTVLAGRGAVDDDGFRARLTAVRGPESVAAEIDVGLSRTGVAVSGVIGARRRAKREPRRLPG